MMIWNVVLASMLNLGAPAAVCDRLDFGAEDDQVVVGEIMECQQFGDPRIPDRPCFWTGYTPKRYGACWRKRPTGSRHWEGEDRQWQLITLEGCTGAGRNQTMEFHMGAGNDRLAVMLDRYEELNPYSGRIEAFECPENISSGERVAIREMQENSPRVRAFMGTGHDRFFGSTYNDEAYTNDRRGTGDGRADWLCSYGNGYGPGSLLVGDADNGGNGSWGPEDYLRGGIGDACFGNRPPSWWERRFRHGEAQVDGGDYLDCPMQRQGRRGRAVEQMALRCGHEFASPFFWRRERDILWPH